MAQLRVIEHRRKGWQIRLHGPEQFGEGEQLDRPELAEIEAMLRSRELDLLICEDISRLTRSVEAVRLSGIAVDHGTRVISPNDCVDTAEENWEAGMNIIPEGGPNASS
ncbi:hypothetical protein AYO44_04280 [Planctomycetaceae bacterium SCGC AG-212-F19]|nr:hypothetical protein AYO44_04280 [Planctomycetaceae bacterium SCGC AG-212-F19]